MEGKKLTPEEIINKIEQAKQELFKICKDPTKFTMSVPAEDSDTDSIIYSALKWSRQYIKSTESENQKLREEDDMLKKENNSYSFSIADYVKREWRLQSKIKDLEDKVRVFETEEEKQNVKLKAIWVTAKEKGYYDIIMAIQRL